MSLIHKALKKAEDHFSTSKVQSTIDIPEEGLIAEEKSGIMGTDLTPRTVGLIVLVVFAGAFAIYTNFFADKKPKKPAPTPGVSVEQQAAVSAADVPQVPPPSVSGVTSTASAFAAGATKLPSDVLVIYEEGQRLFIAGEIDPALIKFEEALTKVPDSPKILNSLGLALKKKGDKVRAEKYYNEALRNDPNCSECLNNLGVLKADEQDNVSAVIYFKKAITEQETYADPYFNLAVIMEGEGNLRSAVEHYKKFLMYTTSEDEGLKDKIRLRIEDLALNWGE